jgi:putative transposase
MPNYRRNFTAGGTYFFTVITYNRQPIFDSPISRKILHCVWKEVQESLPFVTDAICLLPDHIHTIWTLPDHDSNFSIRWHEIKRRFTRHYLQEVPVNYPINKSRQKRQEAPVWQRRFWEHTIRDENDLMNHINYIHYNPVKHHLVDCVIDWPWSSFHRYVKNGFYDSQWGVSMNEDTIDMSVGE